MREFTWDPIKRQLNLRDHAIDLADAGAVFDGPVVERVDDRRDYGEERWVAVGLLGGVEVVVVYIDDSDDDGESYHLILARGATDDERRVYWTRQG